MWGGPVSRADALDFHALYGGPKESHHKAPSAVDSLRPRIFASLAKAAPVRTRDVDDWFRAMNKWTEREQPGVRAMWESRLNWKAVPLWSEIGGPFTVYTIEKQAW
jgi:hypothetical protein